MVLMQNKLVLWTGKKHSGKTTAAARLAQTARAEGFAVAGSLAPSTYRNGRLIGYDILTCEIKPELRWHSAKPMEAKPNDLLSSPTD